MAHVPTEDRRRQIIQAAMIVITREGMARATTRRIAAEADAPLAALHYSFRNKQEIFEAVIAYCQDLTREDFARAQPESGLLAAVHALLKEMADLAHNKVDYHIAQYELFLWALRTPSARSLAENMQLDYLELFKEVLEPAIGDDALTADVDQLARAVLAVADGMTLQILGLGDQGPGEEDIWRYARIAVAGTIPAAAATP